jgi:hypothetical protein
LPDSSGSTSTSGTDTPVLSGRSSAPVTAFATSKRRRPRRHGAPWHCRTSWSASSPTTLLCPDSESVFPAPTGGCLNDHSWRSRFWNPAVRKAGLWPFNPHGMRHTCVALLINQGAPSLGIQHYIGHADIRTTMNTYGHLFPNHDDALARALDGAFRACFAAPRGPECFRRVLQKQMVTQERPSGQILWLITRAVSSVGEHCAYNAGVAGSNPAPPTRSPRGLASSRGGR